MKSCDDSKHTTISFDPPETGARLRERVCLQSLTDDGFHHTSIKDQRQKVNKALDHLQYSYKKVKKLLADLKTLDDEDLETWESFVARFARASDLFLSQYLRTAVLREDPAFRGSFRDFLDQAEKMNLIDHADIWMGIRELRNQSAHEYSEEKLAVLFEAIRNEASRLLELKTKLPI